MQHLCKWVVALLSASPMLSAKANPLEIGYIELPPHIETKEDGSPTGLIIDYFHTVFGDQYQTHLKLREIPFERAWRDILDKRLDGFLTLIETEPRREQITYVGHELIPQLPLLCSLKALKSSEVTVAHLSGTLIPADLQAERYRLLKISGKGFLRRSVGMLKLGRVDAIYHPEGSSLLKQLDSLEQQDLKNLHCEKIGPNSSIKLGLSKHVSAQAIEDIRQQFQDAPTYRSYYTTRIRASFRHQNVVSILDRYQPLASQSPKLPPSNVPK